MDKMDKMDEVQNLILEEAILGIKLLKKRKEIFVLEREISTNLSVEFKFIKEILLDLEKKSMEEMEKYVDKELKNKIDTFFFFIKNTDKKIIKKEIMDFYYELKKER